MKKFETLCYSTSGQVATITLNRPDVSNAINTQMRSELVEAIHSANEKARAVILTGAGKNFCAGADLQDASKRDAGFDAFTVLENQFKPIITAIQESRITYISAINGAAAGIGGAFALACDLVVMAENAYFYQAFIPIGLVPDGGTCWHLVNQLGYKRAYETIIDAEKMSANKCKELGLANRVVPEHILLSDTMTWAKDISIKAPLAIRFSKEALYKAMGQSLSDTITHEAKLQKIVASSQDAKEGIRAFLEKRRPNFIGK